MPVSRRPNILVCLFDSLGNANSGFHNAFNAQPALSALSKKSIIFDNAYTPCPQSSPARASFFTGLDPAVHGLWTNGVSLPDNEHTFPKKMAQAGYINWLVGRWQLAGVSRWTTELTRPGEFAEVDWAHGPLHRSRQNAYLAWLQHSAQTEYLRIFPSQANPDVANITVAQRQCLEKMPDEYSFNYWLGSRIADLIKHQPHESPFMAVAGFVVGDSMGTEPSSCDSEIYNAPALHQADMAISLMINQLSETGRDRDTIVLVSAARGNKNSPGSSQLMSESCINVPLLIHRSTEEARVETSLVSTMDISATLLQLAGVPCGPRMQGQSLLSNLNQSEHSRDWVLSRLRHGSDSVARNWQTAIRSRNMKLIVQHGNPNTDSQSIQHLYDLESDPEEKNDLAGNDKFAAELETMIDLMLDARCAMEDRTEPRIAEF